ncbi:MAG TPA: hypothetical protein VGN57_23130 [Pirellulaceae bacterium]|jgi:uncharacterized protein YjdB|nr:hypothetical protein [Pirellulaceae bacterium]
MDSKALRVDLSPKSEDFEPVAIEPGVPLIDRAGSSERIVRSWFGRLAAQPLNAGDFVEFHVCDDAGHRRQVDLHVLEADDLKRNPSLQADFDAMQKIASEASPKNATEQAIKSVLVKRIASAAEPGAHSRRSGQFFKYRDRDVWRLVWCWGFQRRDAAPLPSVRCSTCSGLFVKRTDSTKCPLCSRDYARPAPTRKKRSLLVPALLALAVPLIGLGVAAAVFWPREVAAIRELPEPFAVSPKTWTGPAGSRIPLTVTETEEGKESRDVTAGTVAIVEDPRVVRIGPDGKTLFANGPGKTVIRFYHGSNSTTSTFDVKSAMQPESLQLEPAEPELGVGSTLQLKAVAKYADGSAHDLTDVVEWMNPQSAALYVRSGRLEGLAPGRAKVVARYRPSAADPYVTASIQADVVEESYEKLELAVAPEPQAGGESAIQATLVTKEGERRSADGSSLLRLELVPRDLGSIEGGVARFAAAGEGTLKASFGELSTAVAIKVASPSESQRLDVTPSSLELALGEAVRLQISGSVAGAYDIVSSAPGIVEVSPEGRAIGRATGAAEITVKAGDLSAKIPVKVAKVEFESIEFVPDRLTIPVGQAAPAHVRARTKEGRDVELVGDVLSTEKLPAPEFAEFDSEAFAVRGIRPTGSSPQRFAVRYGELRAESEIEVVVPPLAIELLPVGQTSTPLGRSVRLQAFGVNGDQRIELPADALTWDVSPKASAFQFDPTTGEVRAEGSVGESAEFVATYFDRQSNRVKLVASEASETRLVLRSDRKTILVGEQGQLVAMRVGADGDEGAPPSVEFTSDNEEAVAIDAVTGAWRAVQPGAVAITAKTPDGESVATEWNVVDPADAKLTLEPADAKIVVGGLQPMKLLLSAGEGAPDELDLASPAASVVIAESGAVRWTPPVLKGVEASEPISLAVEYAGARAQASVQVVDGPVEGLRLTPSEATLVVGQTQAVTLEQLVPGEEETWQEIDPSLAEWNSTQGLVLSNPGGGVRPSVTAAEGASGTLELTAVYREETATAAFAIGSDAPPVDPQSELVVVRDPPGETLAVGQSQRFSIEAVSGEDRQAVPVVEWLPAFENRSVRWEPPTLTALAPGARQWLAGKVGERVVRFSTLTTGESQPGEAAPPPSQSPPMSVRLVSDQGSEIRTIVGARVIDLRVEAVYGAEDIRDVTQQASLSVAAQEGAETPVSVDGLALRGERPGSATVSASYLGVTSENTLAVQVGESPESVRRLELSPDQIGLMVGESTLLSLRGDAGVGDEAASLGDLTARTDVSWTSENEEVATVAAGYVRAIGAGETVIVAALNGVEARCRVRVAAADEGTDQPLTVMPGALRLRVGESLTLGREVTVHRGEIDFSGAVEAAVSDPGVLQFDAVRRAFTGSSVGRTRVAFSQGAQSTVIDVEVVAPDRTPAEAEVPGSIVVEPSAALLIVGETRELRVYVQDVGGRRIDRTSSARIETSDPVLATVQEGRVTALAVGNVEVTAILPGHEQPGVARFEIQEVELDGIDANPARVVLAVGETTSFDFGTDALGSHRSTLDHPDLRWEVGGPNPEAIEVIGRGTIRGVQVGQAVYRAHFGGHSAGVEVEVVDGALSDLRIAPSEIVLNVGERATFAAFVRQEGRVRPVGLEEGLAFEVANSSIAVADSGLAVRAEAPGTTTLVARFGELSTEATVRVVAVGNAVPPPPRNPTSLRIRPDRLTLYVDGPSAALQLTEVFSDGSEAASYRRAEFQVDPPETATVEWTLNGPRVRALAPGRATIVAVDGELRTSSPTFVDVLPANAEQARLRTNPVGVTLAVGETWRLSSVSLVAGGGSSDVRYVVSSGDESIVTVNDDGTFTATRRGSTTLRVAPLDVNPAYEGLVARVPVRVYEPPAGLASNGGAGGSGSSAGLTSGNGGGAGGSGGGAGTTSNSSGGPRASSPAVAASREELILLGPSRTTVGAETSYRVHLSRSGSRSDVTDDGASLVLDLDQREVAEVLPGGRLRALQPGTVTIRAQRRDLISAPISVTIAPVALRFVRIELAIDPQAFAVGESRAYRVWGYPEGGGPRQDLTGRFAATEGTIGEVELRTIAPEQTEVAQHRTPYITAVAAGRFEATATYGDLRSDALVFDVIAPVETPTRLEIEPRITSISVGTHTPPMRVYAFYTSGERREVDAALSSSDPNVLALIEDGSRQFRGASRGSATLVANFGGIETSRNISVVGDRFENVSFSDVELSEGSFTVEIAVRGSRTEATTQYRLVVPESEATTPWLTPSNESGRLVYRQRTPDLAVRPRIEPYRVVVEARDAEGSVVERFPCSFRLVVGAERFESR